MAGKSRKRPITLDLDAATLRLSDNSAPPVKIRTRKIDLHALLNLANRMRSAAELYADEAPAAGGKA